MRPSGALLVHLSDASYYPEIKELQEGTSLSHASPGDAPERTSSGPGCVCHYKGRSLKCGRGVHGPGHPPSPLEPLLHQVGCLSEHSFLSWLQKSPPPPAQPSAGRIGFSPASPTLVRGAFAHLVPSRSPALHSVLGLEPGPGAPELQALGVCKQLGSATRLQPRGRGRGGRETRGAPTTAGSRHTARLLLSGSHGKHARQRPVGSSGLMVGVRLAGSHWHRGHRDALPPGLSPA